jgi:3-hydroxybutyryl-CoA dehydrogenase
MKKVLVIGAGFMGAGIAQVCAQSGYRVFLTDSNAEALEKAVADIKWSVEKLAKKGLVTEAPETVLGRLSPEQGLMKAAESDWVIEAVIEEEGLKKEIFEELDHLAPAETPLASNTSSIPITRLASATERPERVLGLHFFGPVPFMALVEVIKGEKTGDDVFERGVVFVQSLGKWPLPVHRDIPGFVINRILFSAFRECAELIDEGIVTPENIDVGMRLGLGWNIGPFEIADNAGLDTFLRVGKAMKALGEDHLVPRSDRVERMVNEGRLGRKVGKGFYRYTADGKRLPWDSDS